MRYINLHFTYLLSYRVFLLLMVNSPLRRRLESNQLNCSVKLANNACSVHSSVTSQC